MALADEDRRVVVYSTPLCAPCERLKRFLADNDVPFVNRDLMMDEAAAELVERHNIRTAPVLGVGDRLYAGNDLAPDRLRALLKL